MCIHREIKENIISLKISQQIQIQFSLLGLLQIGCVICKSLKQDPICFSSWLFYLQLHSQTWLCLVNGVYFSIHALSWLEVFFSWCFGALLLPALHCSSEPCLQYHHIHPFLAQSWMRDAPLHPRAVSLNYPVIWFGKLTANMRRSFRAQQGVLHLLCFTLSCDLTANTMLLVFKNFYTNILKFYEQQRWSNSSKKAESF